MEKKIKVDAYRKAQKQAEQKQIEEAAKNSPNKPTQSRKKLPKLRSPKLVKNEQKTTEKQFSFHKNKKCLTKNIRTLLVYVP